MRALVFTFFMFSTFLGYCESVEITRSKIVNVTEKATSRAYPLYIKTPRSYSSKTNKVYPVIYLTDAPYAFQLVSAVTRPSMNSGLLEEAIIVGISYEEGSRGSSSRVRDYTPSNASEWKMETGNAENYLNFVRSEVFPYIEKHFRVDASNRTFAGHSLGGLLGAYTLFKHPDMFNNYILGSPSVWFNDNEILASTTATPTRETKVYLSVGSLEQPYFGEPQDMVAGARRLAKKIGEDRSEKVVLKFQVIEGLDIRQHSQQL
ncbi:alpha/beta hydrolase [Salinimonas marina]|uniref:alpha/beta hydrolase n=1 Tax=Salinimonas marina TaxID=2785918 RepID=UPI001E2ABC75|nr:alpha/beta hydrolase-fold protein [Salinimonas marina]